MNIVPDPSGIDQLPNELLAEIFVLYAANTMVPARKTSLRRPDTICHFQWTHIMLVCQRWRAICLGTNALWRTISGGCVRSPSGPKISEKKQNENLKWLELALSRSVGAPLELTLNNLPFATSSRPLLVHNAHRIRSLTIPDYPPFHADAVVRVLDIPMPSLVELDILYGEQWQGARHYGPPDHDTTLISPQRYPLLRSLRLSSLSLVESSIPLFSQLTTLDIRRCRFKGPSFSFYSLLDVLKNCPSLEELQLHRVLSHLIIPSRLPERFSQLLSLKSLRKLVVHEKPMRTRRFLSFLSLSSDVTLHVVGIVDNVADLSDLSSVFPSFLPVKHSSIPLLKSANTVYLRNWEESIELMTNVEGVELRIELDFPAKHNPEDLPGCLKAITTLFRKASLVVLDIKAAEFDTVKHTRTWVHIFSAFPSLKLLSFAGTGSLLSMVCALGHPPTSPNDDANHADKAPPHTDEPVCPLLRIVEVKYVLWQPGFIECLLSVLARRDSCGLPPLESLSLEFKSCEGTEERDLTMDLYAEELLDFVAEAKVVCI